MSQPDDATSAPDEGDEEDEESLESLLDEASTRLPGPAEDLMLRWHYRSRHQDLIAFSNCHFYKNRLLVFAAPLRDQPVTFHHVPNGVYDRGRSTTNHIEANAVVERVREHLERGHGSLGVIALNAAQANLIEDELEVLRRENPHLERFFAGNRLDRVFVKNLESVQGDERDIILISVGYGRDSTGKLTMNFGPINSASGHRRLNVAVTRARDKLEVFSSMHPDELQIGSAASDGAKLLKEYLRYAIHGVDSLDDALTITDRGVESPFEAEVMNALRAMGHEVVPQVGVAGYRIDLGIVDPSFPGRFVLGIECDGASYHSAPTARDRDRLREDVLSGLGWEGRLHRVWSTDWVDDNEHEIEKLRVAVQHAIESMPAPAQTPMSLGRAVPAQDVEPQPTGDESGQRTESELLQPPEIVGSDTDADIIEIEEFDFDAADDSFAADVRPDDLALTLDERIERAIVSAQASGGSSSIEGDGLVVTLWVRGLALNVELRTERKPLDPKLLAARGFSGSKGRWSGLFGVDDASQAAVVGGGLVAEVIRSQFAVDESLLTRGAS